MTHSSIASLQQELNDLIGVPHVREGTRLDTVDGVTPQLVAEPGSESDVAAVLAWCDRRGLAVCPRGGGTKLGWGNPPRALDVVLSLERLNALVEHAHGDMTATVRAGMTFAAFQSELAQHGQMLALDVRHPDHATIGGMIATNDSGALRIRYGGIRDQIIGITVVRADGVIAHGGGRVVKNVAGYDLPKLYTGSLGSLGVITQATFRLYPLPPETRTLVVDVESTASGGRLLLDMLDSTLMPTGLSLRRDADGATTVTAQFSGIRESVEAQLETARRIVDSGATTPFRPSPPGTGGSIAGTPATPGVVLKVSVLPTEIASTVDRAVAIGAANGWDTDALFHAHGLGRIGWNAHGQDSEVAVAIEALRAALAPKDGTTVVLEASLAVKRQLDVWGPAPDALPIMRKVKAELDPRSTLNPGRLIGGV